MEKEKFLKVLGKFYFCKHNNRPPTFLQIIGWTKGSEKVIRKRKYVYVRKVPLKIKHNLNGGEWEFDKDIIKEYSEENIEPIYKFVKPYVDDNAILIDDGEAIRYQKMTIKRAV